MHPEHEWFAFRQLLDAKGVKRGSGGDHRQKQTSTVAVCAKEVGVSLSTAEKRMRQADDYDALPAPVRKRVAAKEATLKEGKAEVRKQKAEASKVEAFRIALDSVGCACILE